MLPSTVRTTAAAAVVMIFADRNELQGPLCSGGLRSEIMPAERQLTTDYTHLLQMQ